jgi:Tat protein translocase TatB subunit
MSLGPAEILVILVVALIAFGPKRLPEVSRQVGSAMRELRRMQDSLRDELDSVLHPDDEQTGATPAPTYEIEAGADHVVHPDVHPDGQPETAPEGSSPSGDAPTNPTIDDHGPSGSFS